MLQVSIDEVQRNLLAYLHRVEAGDTVIILKGGKPVAEMKPFATNTDKWRPFGLCAGEFTVPEDFDEPLPEQMIEEYEGR